MQRTRVRLIAVWVATALSFGGYSAHTAVVTLPQAEVAAALNDAGVDSPWQVGGVQWSDKSGDWTISAYYDRKPIEVNFCSSKLLELDVSEHNGKLTVNRTDRRTIYAFSPCDLAIADEFVEIDGTFDARLLQNDFSFVMAAAAGRPIGTAEMEFSPEFDRKKFATIRRSDIHSVDPNYEGHTRFCFLTHFTDILGAPEIMSVEVIRDSPVTIRVDMCGVLDMTPTKE